MIRHMKIAIFGSNYQKEEQIKKIIDVLRKNGADVFLEDSFHQYLCSAHSLFCNTGGIIKDLDFQTDLVVSIGGDGTFLRSAAKIGDKEIPILGINTGRLGFLADTSYNDFEEALQEIFENRYKIEDRTLLEVDMDVEDGSSIALNEIAILKQDTSSMITVTVSIDGEFLTAYEADGLLVSTPTGSTAYAMSVGGPILSPTLSSLILTPVASHSLTSRPLVVDDSCELAIEVESRSCSYLLSLDGRSTTLSTDVKFKIKKAPYSLKVIRREGQTFYKTLRNKLMWGSDPRSHQ